MKDRKITLERAIKCYKPCRLTAENGKRYEESQKFKEQYGFHYEELWNLDAEFAYFMLVRLVKFKENCYSCPGSYARGTKENPWSCTDADHKRWKTQLNKMIRAFYMYLTIDFPSEKEQKIIDKGMKLFIQHYTALWD